MIIINMEQIKCQGQRIANSENKSDKTSNGQEASTYISKSTLTEKGGND